MNKGEQKNIGDCHGCWSQEEAAYVDKAPLAARVAGMKCSTCTYYANGACSIVEGDIKPAGYCQLWVKITPEGEGSTEELSQESTQPIQEDLATTEGTEETIIQDPIDSCIEQSPEELPKTGTSTKTSNKRSYMIPNAYMTLSQNMLKVPLAKKGRWYHDSYGEVSFTDEDFSAIVDNVKSGTLGHSPYITFGHLDEEPDSTDSHRKRGDLVDISVHNDVLYGFFQAKPEAVEAVTNGEFEFASGEFIRNFTDKSSGSKKGTVFMRVALTNSPFIPFDQDEKVEALSQSEGSLPNSTQDVLPFILSVTMGSTINDEVTIDMTTDNDKREVQEEVTPTTPEAPIETPAVTNSLSMNVDSIGDIIKQVTSQLQEGYKAQLDKSAEVIQGLQDTIGTLQTKLETVTTELASQKEITQAFSSSMSKAQEAQLNESLAKAGLSPSLIEKFSTVRHAIERNESTIKLSLGEGKEEVRPLVQALSQLLVEAVKTEPVSYEQFGMSSKRYDPTGVVSSMEEIIQRNKDQIKNRK